MIKSIRGFDCQISLDLNNADLDPILTVLIKSTASGNQTSILLKLLKYKSITSMKLCFEGFDYFDETNNQKRISGKVFLEVSRNDVVEKHLLASPTVEIPNSKRRFGTSRDNLFTLGEVRKYIINAWNCEFSESQDQLYQAINTPEQNHNSLQVKEKSSFIKQIKILLPRGRAFKILGATVLCLITIYLGLNIYSKVINLSAQKSAIKSLDAESLAKQQDQQLNEAFLDIGIDRSKLTSDLSCFVE